jgi:hypothetical protein
VPHNKSIVTNVKNYFSIFLSLIAMAFLSAIAGCGNGHSVAQIGGKINIKDNSLQRARIRMVRFEPTADTDATIRKGASGTIKEDGSFELYTKRPGDGVYLGKYAVTFAFYRGAMDQKPLIPPKYVSAATTPYQVIVDGDRDDLTFDIEPLSSSTSKRKE